MNNQDKQNKKARKAALYGMLIALAFTFSYLESQLPFNFSIPGVKLGLANLVVLVGLYTLTPKEVFPIALIRILLAGLTFGNTFSLLYSFVGGILSFAVMLVARKTKLSIVGVSMLGGISHNIGQISVAAIALGTTRIAYYLPVLLLAGTLTGLLLGIAGNLIIRRIKIINQREEG